MRNRMWRLRRATGVAVSFALAIGVAVESAAQDKNVQEPLPPWTINTINLDTSQSYQVVFTGAGDVWGTGAPALNVKERVAVVLTGIPTNRIGGFFEACVIQCWEFGAAIDYGFNFAGALTLNAQATPGDVTVRYPVWVTVNWPDWRGLKPGDKFKIGTAYAPDGSAHLTSNTLTFSASMGARVDTDAGITATAKVFSLSYPLSPFPSINVHKDFSVFDSSHVFKASTMTPFDIEGIAVGEAKIPDLTAAGGVGGGADPKWLTSYKADGFLNVGVNVSNLLAKGTLPFKLSDTVHLGPLTLDYHVLSVTPNLSATAEQELIFRITPRIKFSIDQGGQISFVEVNAGETVELQLPDDGSALTITPIIDVNPHSLTNTTGVFASAGAAIDPFRVKASLPTIDLGPFDLTLPALSFNPFNGPKPIGLGDLDLLQFTRTFTLPKVEAPIKTGVPYVISPDPTMPRLVTVCGAVDALNADGRFCSKTLRPTALDRVVFAEAAGGYDNGTEVHVNGVPVEHSPFGAAACAAAGGAPLLPGQLCLTIPALDLYGPGELRVQLFNPPSEGHPPNASDFSNIVDLHVLAFELSSSRFKNPVVFQFDGTTHDCDAVCPPLPPPVGGVFPLEVFLQTNEFVSRGALLDFISAGSAIRWDGVPLETSIALHDKVTMDGTTPVHTATYDLTAIVPLGMQSGGDHTLSFINAGINAEDTALQTVQVFDPAPHIDSVYPAAASQAAQTLAVSGHGFRPGSIVEWDGVAHASQYSSSNALELLVPAAELVPGDHQVVVRNPTGGPSNAVVYTVAPALGGSDIIVQHSLFRDGQRQIGDVVTFTNGGGATIDDLEITSMKLQVGAGGSSVNLKLPQTIPGTAAGESNSLIGLFPNVGTPGQSAEIRVRARLNGKEIHIDLPVVIPE